VLHLCDNPPCLNPAHLHLGTRRVNSQEAWQRGRCESIRESSREVMKRIRQSPSPERLHEILLERWRTGVYDQRPENPRDQLGRFISSGARP
jgi:hypothetical protein